MSNQTIQKFSMTRDINGYNGFGIPFSNNKYMVLLEQDVEKTLTVPATGLADFPKLLAVFSNFGSSVWVALNATAEYPTNTDFALTDSEQNPQARYVKAGDVLHFMTSEVSAEVGVIFYAVS